MAPTDRVADPEAPISEANCLYKKQCPLYADPSQDTTKRFEYNWLRGSKTYGFDSIEDLLNKGTWEQIKGALAYTGMRYQGDKLVQDVVNLLESWKQLGLTTGDWTAIEAGPGSGDQLYFLTQYFRRIVGVEFDEQVYKISVDFRNKLLACPAAAPHAAKIDLHCDDICNHVRQHRDEHFLLMSMTMCHLPLEEKWGLIRSIGESDIKVFVYSCIFAGDGFSGHPDFVGIHLAPVQEHLRRLREVGFVLVSATPEKGWREFVKQRYEGFMDPEVQSSFKEAVSSSSYETQLGFFRTIHEAFERGMVGATLVLVRESLATEFGLKPVEWQQ
uniref:Methyltransferase domain-containing protein n=1 Tax=Tetraselmis sp. GSL018 TaxID=582737 RepID=A0A061R3K1_9CHLO|mmetsp:Transcript_29108/g.69527  ORF Transcript_29108/g.69527 Transcript_29108/m.69527 type:complete len:330 (+) Transcript_29108:201-1190(+)|eukprot:CAMPEP_0177604960 /NCGR_PEP_ID=MMETSP0419_2-20121207/16420_1 /TAXON_ID=582737 /ORGANISM="Tetraselmis sp., Strain GSL018" /LENGTH=329 /DNA_ID=CAMNT_0019099025 /DNA_START=155 /DNA_END=1144 /DNA_ORIENTATION=+